MPTLKSETRSHLANVGVSTLTNGLLKRGLRNQYLSGVSPVTVGLPNMVGPAFTLRFIPAREDIDTLVAFQLFNNVQRRAIEECPPGSVLVVDSCGESRSATAGDLMIGRLKVRGCAGIVTDGGFRDLASVMKLNFPAYQRRTCSGASPIGLHSADLEVPIGCANVAVYPGDIVVGDSEGVVVLPAALADELAEEAADATVYEEFAEQKIAENRSIFDIFPPTEQTRLEFDSWKADRGSRLDR